LEYIENVLKRFNMNNANIISTPLSNLFKLTKKLYPKTNEETKYMRKVTYAFVVGSLI